MNQKEDIYIIGAGLSGLTLAYLLSKKGIASTILEASNRIGGRIQTIKGQNGTPLELGATWFSDLHPHLIALLEELELEKFPQYSKGKSLFQTKSFEPPQEFSIPEAQQPSYRIAGGTQALTDALAAKLPSDCIKLNNTVIGIEEQEAGLTIQTEQGETFSAEKVILSLPPQLAGSSMRFSPELPETVSQILPTVQTWMAGSIKFVLEYERPFWREKGYSGMLYSHAGIVTELYDHTNLETNKYGFTGFLNGSAAAYTQEVRKEFVLQQLAELLGKDMSQPLLYEDKVWRDEFITSGTQLVTRPHQNNGHSLLQKTYMNSKLFFSGTEVSPVFSGYMEGAVVAAKQVFQRLLPYY